MAKKKGLSDEPKEAKPSKAALEKDKEEGPKVYRADLGESIPTPLLKTATDK